MNQPSDRRFVLLYCRAGFEGECGQEIAALAASAGAIGHVRALRDQAFCEYRLTSPADAAQAHDMFRDSAQMIFARQKLNGFAQLENMSREDRLTPILQLLRTRGESFNDAWVEAPDTNEGKTLAAFCRSFGNALIGALKKERMLDKKAPRRLHAFFPQSDNVYLATADPLHSSPWPQGIARLKFPHDAPSRSTLKLDEAFATLLSADERERWLKPGMTAVDLGAAPGGWTWQLVRRSIHVTAIDNGPMDAGLMNSGIVTHLREDGFRYRPHKPVDWLVCDMVEQPLRVAELIASWFADGTCRRAVFNLKLPMKKRYEETLRCLDLVRNAGGRGRSIEVRARQLYHDREEITAFAQVVGRPT